MADIIPNQSLGAMGARNLSAGLGEGLQALAQHKIKEIQRGKKIQSYQKTFNVSPQDAESLAMLEESSPNTFHHLVSQLGGGTQPGQQLEEGQEPQFNRFVPGGNKIEAKEDRQRVNKYLDTFHKKSEAISGVGKEARQAKKLLEDINASGELPGRLTNRFSQKNIPWASSKVRTLETLYEKIINKVAAAEAAGTGFRAAGVLSDAARASKSALDQPYETQLALLDSLIDEENDINNKQKTILALKNKNGGKYPTDLEDMLIEMGLENKQKVEEQKVPEPVKEVIDERKRVHGYEMYGGFPDPKLYPENQEIEDPNTGEVYVKKNDKWELKK